MIQGLRGRVSFIILGGAFFVSGACALVYQVAWQRILALHSGVGALSIAVIVGAFMTGLGLGSHVGGGLSARLPARTALLIFALLELGIGVFGASSVWLYYDVLFVRFVHLYRDPVQGALLHVCALLLPTVLMGMSLPLLVRGSVRSVGAASRTIGTLYGLNVLGASVGAVLTPWLLVRFVGVRGALWAAALGNAVAGLGGLLVVLRSRPASGGLDPDREEPRAPAAEAPSGSGEKAPLLLWTTLYAASGFCALALELVWFRIMDVAVKSTAFTFGTVLSLYLLGAGLGSLLVAGRVRSLSRPLAAFLLCQCLLLAYAGAVVLLLVALPEATPGLRALVTFWGEPSSGFVLPWGDRGWLAVLYLLLPTVLFGLPTLLMGASFPILQRAVQDDPRTSGKKVGLLQAANIAGCTLASLGLGLLGFSLLGTAGALRVLLLIGVAFALLGMRHGPRAFAGLAAALLGLAVALPGQDALWRRVHGAPGPATLVEEDATGVAALVAYQPGRWRVVFGGKSHSSIPFGGTHSYLGAIPAVVHPAPLDVAIIGLGSGDSAWAAGCRQETRSVTVFELSAVQPRLLRRLANEAKLPQLRRFLDDPRVAVKVQDGRNALATGEALYDIIEADALMPTAAYSGNLYSEQFFEVCLRRLKPGGILCTWAPTPRVVAGLNRVFPHVVALEGGQILLGSRERIPLLRASWRELLTEGPVFKYLGGRISHEVLDRLRRAQRMEGAGRGQANDDLFPRDEFASPDPEPLPAPAIE